MATHLPNSAAQAAIPAVARKRWVLGLDEAGRGAVLGPLVVVGVVLDPQQAKELAELGVQNSKRLTRTRRAKLTQDIKGLAKRIEVQVRSAAEVDAAGDLDCLEREAADEILKTVGPIGRVVADGRQVSSPWVAAGIPSSTSRPWMAVRRAMWRSRRRA